MKTCVAPEQPGGVRDYPPRDMIPRQEIIERVRRVFQRFGFDPLETPMMERLEVLTGGRSDFAMAIYETKIRARKAEIREDHRTALRFDLTVPLARFVAANPDLPKPFKRYQIGSVFRGERPQKGRFREFIQFDADIVGSSHIQSDVEIIWLMYETMSELGIEDFQIKVNNRKVLNGLPEFVGFNSARMNDVLRIVDKLDKIEKENVIQELKTPPTEYLDGLGFSDEQVDRLFSFLDLRADDAETLITKAMNLLSGIKIAEEGLVELQEIATSLAALQLRQERWCVDFSIARGLDYYTGPVFETMLTSLPAIGSVFSGGRYDGLVSRFMENAILPATGASVGIDRLYAALVELGKIEEKSTNLNVLLLRLDEKYIGSYNKILRDVRKAGFNASLYLGEEKSFQGQFAAGLKLESPVLLILGEDEMKRGTVQVKNTRTRKQVEVPQTNLLEQIRTFMGT